MLRRSNGSQQAADIVATAEAWARDIVAEAQTTAHGTPTMSGARPARITDAATLTDPPSSSV